MQKDRLYFGIVFGAVGLICFGIALNMLYLDYVKTNSKIAVEGKIIVADRHSTAEFSLPGLQDQNRKFTATTSVSVSPPAYSQGETVVVYVNPENPEDVVIDGIMERFIGPLVMIPFVLAFGGIGIGHLWPFLKTLKRQSLVGRGIKATGRVVRVSQVDHLTIDNKHPWYIEVSVRHPMLSTEMQLKSHPSMVPPKYCEGQSIDIYFDPENPNKYFIDSKVS